MPEIAKVPAIRFKGFTDTWEHRKLGEVGSTYTGLSGKSKIDFGHGEGRYVTYMNVFTNAVSSPKMVEPIEIDAKQNEVKAGDVFFTTSSETPEEVGMSSVMLENSPNTYLNSFCFGYRTIEKFDNYYLAYMLRSDSVRENIVFLAQGISRYNISKNKVMEIEVPIPQMAEQRLLGEFFCNLDNLIALHQCKLLKLKNLKKAMLEKMFPKNGSSVPEIRFAGFTDVWEQRKLAEMTSLITKGTTPLDKSGNGNINFVKIESIDSSSGRITITSTISEEEHNGYLKRSQLEVDDVLFSIAGTLGRVATVNKDILPANTNQALAIIRLKNCCIDYITTYLKGKVVSEFVKKNPTVGAQPNLSLEQVGNLEIDLPNSVEQKKIGLFFKNLDNLITLHQRKHEKLQNIKKACLERMFV